MVQRPGIGEGQLFYRPDLDLDNAAVSSWVYMMCLDPLYQQAEHYTPTRTRSHRGFSARARPRSTAYSCA